MKVIVAGFAKTGTKSMNAALSELGYKVYDFLDNYMYLYDDWKKIFDGDGSVEDLIKMYKGVDAVTDAPAYLYWYELHQAFPDAKIILTTREEEAWYKSWDNNMKHNNEVTGSLFGIYSTRFVPVVRFFYKHFSRYADEVGVKWKNGFFCKQRAVNQMYALHKFRRHNACVLQKAPKDKLLVYSVKEGWEPLCKFLGKEIPDTPFPRENIGGKNQNQQMNEHEFGRLKRQQTIASLVVFMLIGLVVCYCLDSYPVWFRLFTCVCGFALLCLVS